MLRAAELVPPGRVLVVGAGAIGRLWIQVLILRGHEVLAVDPRADRLAGARGLGAEVDEGPVAAAVLTAPAGIGAAVQRLEPGGTLVVFAAPEEDVPVSLDAVYRKELAVRGSRSATPAYFRDAVELLPQLVLPPVTTLPLERFLRGRRALSPRRRVEGRLHAVKAARLYGPDDLRIEDVPRPEPGPGDVLVQIEVALTDGTDLKTYRRGHPLLARESPAPFGHEFCGLVDGRRVVAANSAPCGACDGCARGEQCRALEFLAGAYADWLVVPERIAAVNLHPVPPTLAPEVAAMVEPLACCLRGVERAGIDAGDRVAILGAGPIGLMLAACVADAGGWPVIVGGREERQELIPAFGAEPGDGRDADVVVEAAGTQTAWQDAIGLARPGGTVVMFGGLPRDARPPVDAYRVHYDELTVRGAFHHTPSTVRAALAFLASGAYPWERLITHRVLLRDLPALFADPPRDLLKAAVTP